MTVMEINDLLQTAGTDNFTIFDGLVKANSVINDPAYNTIICSISGGSDSDIVLDICHKLDRDKKIIYAWFDTGLEYQATKDHLNFLEAKYGITIHREKAIKPIPTSCRTYGQPFLSKQVSEFMSRLQRHNFQWEDEPFEILIKKYPNCKSALEWWCDTKESNQAFGIERNKYLKEFIVQNPPTFKIGQKCCTYAKKNVSKELLKRYDADLIITGIRRSEGGARSFAYKSCFSSNCDTADQYRPIFWYTDEDKREYEKIFGITHSGCYTKYGLTRTGCAGCPYNREIDEEIRIIGDHEPKLFKAVNKIFADSYEYTNKYREFRAMRGEKELDNGQMDIFDYLK